MNLRLMLTLLAFIILAIGAGCGKRTGPYQSNAQEKRDIQAGERLFQKAIAVIDEDPEKAEELLHQALTADLYHGPAHNNLGVLLLGRGRLYDAASEFEWAGKLLPGFPQPRVNLAMVLDRGGKAQEALAACAVALEIQPGYLPAHQEAALIQANSGVIDATTIVHLDAIINRSTEPTWREWALGRRARVLDP